MNKIIFSAAIVSAIMFGACSDEKDTAPKEDTPVEETSKGTEDKSDSSTQEELNAKLKEETTAIDFVAANGGEVAENTKVKAQGVIKVIISEGVGGEFMLTTTEGEGFGVYTIVNLSMTEIVEGDEVTIYGTFAGKDDLGMPKIIATIIN